MIRLLKKEPGKSGEILEVKNDLKSFQKIVEGYIEVYPLTDELLVILNEEGKLLGLKPNIKISLETIVGTIAIVRDGGEDFTSLTDRDIKFLQETGLLEER